LGQSTGVWQYMCVSEPACCSVTITPSLCAADEMQKRP